MQHELYILQHPGSLLIPSVEHTKSLQQTSILAPWLSR
jgi:hypothetical protein